MDTATACFAKDTGVGRKQRKRPPCPDPSDTSHCSFRWVDPVLTYDMGKLTVVMSGETQVLVVEKIFGSAGFGELIF
jgi:hypothetical protein